MNDSPNLTPKDLFALFRKDRIDVGKAAVADFMKLSDEEKQSFLQPTKKFLSTEQQDTIRAWGSSVLQEIGGDEAFQVLVDSLEKADDEEKQGYRYTRFFTLRAIERLADTESRRQQLDAIINRVKDDEDEQGFIWASALILLSNQGDRESEDKLIEILKNQRDYWPNRAVMRALREFPQPRLTGEVLSVMRNSQYLDLKFDAIRILRSPQYREDVKVIRALGEIVITEPARHVRLEAVRSLGSLGNREAEADLLQALRDDDAEIRKRASDAFLTFLSKEEAISTIVQQILREGIGAGDRDLLVEAVRRIDPDRGLAGEILGKELTGEDRNRAEVAERILIDLGGWTALQKLGQRRSTLESLDKLLADSEQIVKSTFNDTIRQARTNFYFAMVVNVLVVAVGLALIVIALRQLVIDPELIGTWLVPGGAGVIGIILNLGFNNPRRNAREDLAALLNVNVIFLGYLRQLNEIDATFKYAFIENEQFGTEEMKATVGEIDRAMIQTLKMGARHLYLPLKSAKTDVPDRNDQGDPANSD